MFFFFFPLSSLRFALYSEDDIMSQNNSHLRMVDSIEPFNGLKWSSFQRTIESNYAIAIAALCDWLIKNIAQVFQPMRSKTKTKRTLFARFFGALSKLKVIAGNSDWFIALFAPVVITKIGVIT